MRSTLLPLTLLSVSIALSAQQPASATFIRPRESEGCPVNFGAQINSRAVLHTAADAKRNGLSPLLQLTFRPRDTPKVLSANITIHGLSSSSRYMPVGESSDENRIQTFALDHEPGAADLANVEVLVTKMPLVRWVEVTELKYADGSTWHPSSDAQCRAVPSGFRLVKLTPQ